MSLSSTVNEFSQFENRFSTDSSVSDHDNSKQHQTEKESGAEDNISEAKECFIISIPITSDIIKRHLEARGDELSQQFLNHIEVDIIASAAEVCQNNNEKCEAHICKVDPNGDTQPPPEPSSEDAIPKQENPTSAASDPPGTSDEAGTSNVDGVGTSEEQKSDSRPLAKILKMSDQVPEVTVYIALSSLIKQDGEQYLDRLIRLFWYWEDAYVTQSGDKVILFRRNEEENEVQVLEHMLPADTNSGWFQTQERMERPVLTGLTEYEYGWIVRYYRGEMELASYSYKTHPKFFTNSRNFIQNLTILEAMIPGGHDFASGANFLIEEQRPGDHVYCQEETVYDLLISGIRALDIRPAYFDPVIEGEDKDDNLWISHNFVPICPITRVIGDIKKFLAESPMEIIFFDCHEFHNFDDSDKHVRLAESLIKAFENLIIPPWLSEFDEFEAIFEEGKTIFLTYKDVETCKRFPKHLRPAIDHAWANTDDLGKLKLFLENAMEERPNRGKLWSANAELTEGFLRIAYNTATDGPGLRAFAEESNKALNSWFIQWCNKANIVSTDFCLGNNVPDIALRSNPIKQNQKILIPRLPRNQIGHKDRPSQNGLTDFESSKNNLQLMLRSSRILVVGAGRLGCQVVMDLKMLGFHYIHIVDKDRVEERSVDQNFIFGKSDVGKPKALMSAQFMNSRTTEPGVAGHYAELEELGVEFLQTFHVIVCCTSQTDTQSYLNRQVTSLFRSNASLIVPIVAGHIATDVGDVRVFIPGETSCLQCDFQDVREGLTAAAQTDDVILYALNVTWPAEFPNSEFDVSAIAHIEWICGEVRRIARTSESLVAVNYTIGMIRSSILQLVPLVSARTRSFVSTVCASEVYNIIMKSYDNINMTKVSQQGYNMNVGRTTIVKQLDCAVCGEEAMVEQMSDT